MKLNVVLLCFFFFASLIASYGQDIHNFQSIVLDAGLGKVVAGDVDNDGITDLIRVAGLKGESMSLFKFDRNGKYKKYTLLDKINFRGDRLALYDIDQDGDLDLVTGIGNNDANGKEINLDVVWVENPYPQRYTRVGSWKVHKVGNQKDYIKDIDVADFDRDGKPDIITRANEKTAIYFQSAPAKWQNDVVIEHESHEGMDIGDLDKDGDTDIILNGFWYETPEKARMAAGYRKHVFDPKWFTKVDNSWRDNNVAIKVIDMDQDGLLDILISHSELTGFPISLYMANSVESINDDQWRETQVAETFDFCQTLDAADVDNDGDLDILAAKFRRNPTEGSQFTNEPPFPIVVYYNTVGTARSWQEQRVADDGMYAGALADLGSNGSMDIVGPQSYFEGPTKMYTPAITSGKLSLDKWHYIEVDDSRDNYVIPGASGWWNYFGLDIRDVNRDGYGDIVAGEWYYRNPGGDMTSEWERVTFPLEVDAVLALEVDGDEFADVIGMRLPQIYWLEANDVEGKSWTYTEIGTMRQTGHANIQEYSVAQLVPGGKPELVLGDEASQYYFEIPDNPSDTPWPHTTISNEGGGYATGDIDLDGFIDLVGSVRREGVGEVLPGTSDVKKDNSMMVWWKNPGNGKGSWPRFEIGTGTSPERCIVADLNGDGRLDIATSDERYPGNARNANLTWYEHKGDPSKKGWLKHIIVTSKSMNSMDAADIDRDGDIDLVVGEHEMMGKGMTSLPKDEKVIVFENDGKGNFTPHTVDQGKESHLGTQLSDLDGDGDLDIVSIAWREPKYLHVWRNDAIKNDRKREISPSAPIRKFTLPIVIDANGFERTDKPVEVQLNFTPLLSGTGIDAGFSESSLVLVEADAAGKIIDRQIPFQFEKASEFDSSKKALGTLVFILKGKTAANQSRHFRLYFDDTEHPQLKKRSTVSIEDAGEYEGFDAYRIKTPTAEYYYHKETGGFASIIDRAGNDWVSYHPNEEPESGMKGRYRGIPNIAPAELHPGETDPKKSSEIISEGPVRVSVMTQTEDKQWKTRWDIYPEYATMTLLKKGDQPYWILYEGTPGGEFNEEDFWVRSDGTREVMKPYQHKDQWIGHLPSPKWVYFGDHQSDRVLYYIHHEDYPYQDTFWHSGEGNMTVFGFGRGPSQDNWQQLTKAPARLTLGFSEKSDFPYVRERINDAYKSLGISVGSLTKNK